MDENKNEINIELTEDIADGIYSNLVLISHSGSEFILDFIRIVPGMPKAKVHSRVIMAPPHAKGLLRALGENIDKYEAQFGEIPGQPGGPNTNQFNFKPRDLN